MPGVNAGCQEFGAVLHHGCEHPFPVEVDKGQSVQIDYALACFTRRMCFFPTRLKLSDPRSRQPALQAPSLHGRIVGDRDSQHCRLLPRMGSATGVPNSWSEKSCDELNGLQRVRRNHRIQSSCQQYRAAATPLARCRYSGTSTRAIQHRSGAAGGNR
jgi:hypothetical protein